MPQTESQGPLILLTMNNGPTQPEPQKDAVSHRRRARVSTESVIYNLKTIIEDSHAMMVYREGIAGYVDWSLYAEKKA